uniref:Uncharacterized protein n=1 Tax=Myoviridae sp. ctFYw8 TaxID=2825069 RepID=A0A8S5PDJ3_9CAUD|nr:MAG TPA: hypothetical protein [Myoviridae sp. ctFYw8]
MRQQATRVFLSPPQGGQNSEARKRYNLRFGVNRWRTSPRRVFACVRLAVTRTTVRMQARPTRIRTTRPRIRTRTTRRPYTLQIEKYSDMEGAMPLGKR